MTVRHEIKSQLAKLLATEDLVVEHKQVKTASFNVHTRVLTLPVWDKASNEIYDLLVGHEVGHALYTPDEDWSKNRTVPPQFVNVTEDARIEKLMKRKYAGLNKTFYRGYSELSDQDFFELEDEDVDSMNLADRVNLYFKIGRFIPITFTEEERQIVDQVGRAESFEEALDAAEALYKYCKSPKTEKPKASQQNQNQQGQVTEEQVETPSEESNEDGDKEWFTDDDPMEREPKTAEENDLDTPSYEYEEPEVKTDEAFQDNIENLASTHGEESIYVEMPKLDMKRVIASWSEVLEYCDQQFTEQQEIDNDRVEYNLPVRDIYQSIDDAYKSIKKSSAKEVSYLVKEFECRKSADAYARSTTSRTGVLDTSKLHTYRYNEDLFKKISVVPDGKNHGLVFVLDWSGSMSHILEDTCKQLFNLIWFCTKVKIPFEVYLFTNHWNNTYQDYYVAKENQLRVCNDFSMVNFLSSEMKPKVLDKAMMYMWRIAYSQRRYFDFSLPRRLSLSGTPLNESIVALRQILPEFKSKYKLQKVQCVMLTDGEACPLSRHILIHRRWEAEPSMLHNQIHPGNVFLRDREIGKTYLFGWNFTDHTTTLLTNLRDRMPDVNFIGIRVLAPKEKGRFVHSYFNRFSDEAKQLEVQWKKTRSLTMKDVGYHAYFGLSSTTLSNDTEFDISSHATKAQIRNAFKKSLSSKKMNKKILSEFISLVC